jgi:hypothetical protein
LRISQRCDAKTSEPKDPQWIEGQWMLPQKRHAPFCDRAVLPHRAEPAVDRA